MLIHSPWGVKIASGGGEPETNMVVQILNPCLPRERGRPPRASAEVMARGLSREQSKEKNLKNQASNKGNQEGLSSQARAERDAAKLQEKQAANAAKKAELLASGADGAAQVAAMEKEKAAQREAKRERMANSTQAAKVRWPPLHTTAACCLHPLTATSQSAPKHLSGPRDVPCR